MTNGFPCGIKKCFYKALCVLCLVALQSSCSISKIASNMTSTIFKEGSPVFEQESDVEVAEVSGLAMIKTLEVFSYHNPTNTNYLTLLAKSYGTYALGFLENKMLQYQYKDTQKYQMYFDRAKLFYSRGKDYGLRGLRESDGTLYTALSRSVDQVRKRMRNYGADEIELVFWAAFDWGGLINFSKDDISAVADLAMVEAMMARIADVKPGFYYGAPNLFYGVYYASRPAMLGGSPEKAKKYFEKASKVTDGKNLIVYALEAQYLAPQTMDKGLFHEMIADVEQGKVDALPAQRLANALAKERAKFLKDNESHYF